MQLTPEQIAAILDDAKPSIIAGLRDEVIRQAKWTVSDTAGKIINEEVVAFVKTEIIPEVQSALTESREGLVAVAVDAANTIAVELATALAKDLKTRLENSYNRKQIFEALFSK